MSLKKRITHESPEVAEELRRRLADEWRNPQEGDVEPFIIEESGNYRPTHLYVIWKEWADRNQQQRSEIIMDAFEDVKGRNKVLDVTVAMGLTPVEAKRMHIDYQ